MHGCNHPRMCAVSEDHGRHRDESPPEITCRETEEVRRELQTDPGGPTFCIFMPIAVPRSRRAKRELTTRSNTVKIWKRI